MDHKVDLNSNVSSALEYREQLLKWSKKLTEGYETGELEPSTHYMLGLLSVRGSPMTLEDHFMFKPMFRFPSHQYRPQRSVYKTARQVGKTFSLVASDILNCQALPHWQSLFVTPLFEQIKKISTKIAHPMVAESLFKEVLLNKSSLTGVLSKTYKSGGSQTFSYAYLDSMRIRSISGIDACNIDETQHILKDHLPVILETMSARPQTSFVTYTGTPLSFANPLESLWKSSTMCEWVIKCDACNKFNIPNMEHDLIQMIGRETVICSKCSRPLNPKKGTWVSPLIKNPGELWEEAHEGLAGFHISQIIHPLHYNYRSQWKNLLYKMNTYSPARFSNEVCGESYDSADRMITLEELAAACNGNPNTLEDAVKARQNMDITAMGIDWGGGGEDTPSYTKLVIGGCKPGSLDVKTVYMEHIPKYWPISEQLEKILSIFRTFRPDLVAHDYQGMGHVYEPYLLQLGIPEDRLWNIAYVTAPTKPIMFYNDPSEGNRDCFNLDRCRSLSTLFNMIKNKRLTFPDWDSLKINSQDPNLREVTDFLSMHGEEIRRPNGHNVYVIQTDPDQSDDYVQATNFMAAACWFRRGEFPALDSIIQQKLTVEDLSNICPDLVIS